MLMICKPPNGTRYLHKRDGDWVVLFQAPQSRFVLPCPAGAGRKTGLGKPLASNQHGQLASSSCLLSQQVSPPHGPSLVIREQKLPNQQLFNGIKSCNSWLECSQLLARNADRMDAMLLSTLVTQTVCVKSGPVKSCNQQLLHPQKRQQEHVQSQDPVQGSISPGNSTGSNPSRVAVAAVADSTHGITTGSSATTSNRTTISSTEPSNSSTSSSTHKQRLLQDSPDSRSAAATFWVYMRQLAQLALQLCETFRPQQFSNVLWGLAKCGLRPASSWIDSYLGQAELHLVSFPPRNLAQLMWAVATMQVVPSRPFCANFLAESGEKMAGFLPIDIANTVWALATLGIQPPPDWLAAALSAAEQQWQRFKPQEIGITLWGFAKLGQDLGVIRRQQLQQGFGTCRGLDETGFGKMMMTVAWQFPGMTAQQCSHVLWGVVVGGAGRDLSGRQIQWLADQALAILYQSSSITSSRQANQLGHSLCSVLWSLTRLQLKPTHLQAQKLIQMLAQHCNSSSSSSSSRQAAMLLWCCGRLQVRPPAEVIHRLLQQQQAGLAAGEAVPADLVQALKACRALGWCPGKAWWSAFYSFSVEILEDASVSELAVMLAAAAAVLPLAPPSSWRAGFWDRIKQSLNVTMQVRRLKRCGQLVTPLTSSSSSSSSSSATAHGSSMWLLRAVPDRSRLSHSRSMAGSSSSSSSDAGKSGNSSSSSSSRSSSAEACRSRQLSSSSSSEGSDCSSHCSTKCGSVAKQLVSTARLQMTVQRSMRALLKLQFLAAPLPVPHTGNPSLTHQLFGRYSAVLLLWSCARLQQRPPKTALWQILILILADFQCYSDSEVAVILWSLGQILSARGHHTVQCHTLLQLLVVAAQGRLQPGVGADVGLEQSRLKAALRMMAHAAQLRDLLLLLLRRTTSQHAVAAAAAAAGAV